MPSISAFDYRNSCKVLVRAALQRPQMYFKSLEEFEAFMRGHEAAFGQIAHLDRSEMLQEGFSNWLYEKFGLSCASGWAYAIEQQSQKTGDAPLALFGRFVNAFFDSWNGQSEAE